MIFTNVKEGTLPYNKMFGETRGYHSYYLGVDGQSHFQNVIDIAASLADNY